MRKSNRLLRLTPFEEDMFWDETPAYPMFCFQYLHFTGALDHSFFEESIADALKRHPLMNARVVLKRGKPYWEPLTDSPVIHYERGDSREVFAHFKTPDIRKAAGVAFVLNEKTGFTGEVESVDFGFWVHHSVSDASGVLAFLEDVFIGYARRTGKTLSTTEFRPISEESWALRHNPGLSWRRYFKIATRGVISTLRLLFHFPEPVLPVGKMDRSIPPKEYFRFRELGLTKEESERLHQVSKRLGVTINDLLLRAAFLSNADFKAKYLPKSNRWIRIAMPINMRPRNFPNLFATNVVSMVFLDRRPSQISSSDEFLAGIHQETDWIKRTDQGLSFLENIKGRRNLPGGIQMELKNGRCWTTTVFSNLGRLFSSTPLPRTQDGKLIVGDAILESFSGMPPLRSKTLTSWGGWSYAGAFHFAVTFDSRYLTPEQAEETVRLFKRRIDEMIPLPASVGETSERMEKINVATPFSGDFCRTSPVVMTQSPLSRRY